MLAVMTKGKDTTVSQERKAKFERFMLILGYAIVGASVVGGFVLSFYPRAFGLQESNPAIGFGLAVLAGFRIWALRREVRKQAEEPEDEALPPRKPRRRQR